MEENKYLRVREINNYIKGLLDHDLFLNKVFIKGEISNFKNHPTGHLYFSLKDDDARINAVMFNRDALKLTFKVEDGMNVLVTGRISAYPMQGSYQIYVEKMELDGLGALYIEYEKLKKRLAYEGLFAKEKKQAIPKFPEKIGVVTASSGAAVRDIMSTIKRRYPICEVILFPCLVQGKEAAESIVTQIKRADEFGVDTIIVGRGGGSIEDLWAFNEEIVARAIYECKTPIISAVGHEIDWTIADFVADLRAPTPTGAAEMAVPTILDINNLIDNYKIRLNKNIKSMINTKFITLRNFKNNFVLKNPMAIYEVKMQKFNILVDNLNKGMEKIINAKQVKWEKIKSSYILKNPYNLLEKKKNQFDLMVNTLKLLNPLNILEKGYSVVKVNKKVIKSSQDLKINDKINIKLYEGEVFAKVEEIKK